MFGIYNLTRPQYPVSRTNVSANIIQFRANIRSLSGGNSEMLAMNFPDSNVGYKFTRILSFQENGMWTMGKVDTSSHFIIIC